MPQRAILIACAPILFALLLLAGPAVPADEPTAEQLDFFEKKVRPVLVENCFKCHSTEGKQRADLVLDSREGLLKSGQNGPALVPGHPEKSRLIKAISYTDPKLRMPKDGKLAQQQIDDLTAWVKMGAPWPKGDKVGKVGGKKFDLAERAQHWSFQPVKKRALPQVTDEKWARSPIDYFILAGLEKAGLKPNGPTDRTTLLRRVYFDLIGLPPTPAEIDAFLKDDSPEAYAKVVDRLLASPQYGERWGRHWLDLVRFAETSGHEFDFDIPDAWRYRDYVIRAFNDDVPYNQFVMEHIAGDLLPQPRLHPLARFNESILGTGFWYLGEAKHSPVDVLGDQADRLDNQIDVFSKTFLGLTLSCARCHDHKFDPITTKDYYALVGYLQSSRFQRAFIDDPELMNKGIAALQALRAEIAKLTVTPTVAELKKQCQDLPALLAKLPLPKGNGDPYSPLHPWHTLRTTAVNDFAAEREKVQQELAALIPDPAKYETFADFASGTAADWFNTGHAFGTGTGLMGQVAISTGAPKSAPRLLGPHMGDSGLISKRLQGGLRSPAFTIGKKNVHFLVRGNGGQIRVIIDGYQLIKDPIYGKLEFGVKHGDAPQWHSVDVGMWIGHRAYVEVLDDGDGWVGVDRIVFADAGPPPAATVNPLLLAMLADAKVTSADMLAERYRQLLLDTLDHWQTGTLAKASHPAAGVALLNWLLGVGLPGLSAPKVPADMQPKVATLLQQYVQAEAKLPTPARALAMMDGTPMDEKVYIRGNHQTKGALVPRRFLEVFAGDKGSAVKGSGRLELAQQVTDPANPLTARVMVNRIWKHHFGQGLVASVDNFGILGEKPSHPELLDWLAAEFIQQGWSIKKMHRLMLLSSTYQMSSQENATAKKIDPDNRLLHRMPVKRLEGEIIRDALLAVSGRLDLAMYGPGVMPFLTPYMIGRGRPSKSGPLDGDGRRSIYINVRRNFLTPMFLVFDYPLPFTTIGKRSVSNVPAQALTMMNNDFVLQQTKLWAAHVLATPGLTPAQRLDAMYLTALGRPPSPAESAKMLAFLGEASAMYGQPNDPRAWHDLCHVIVNLKEFIYVR